MAKRITAITREERDKYLRELDNETRRWAKSERKRIEGEAEFLRGILDKRPGAGKLTSVNIEFASKLTSKNINQLLGVETTES